MYYSPSDATREIKRRLLNGGEIIFTDHIQERMEERNIDHPDILTTIKSGIVKCEAELDKFNSYRYKVESNLNGGIAVVVVIPEDDPSVILITTFKIKKRGLVRSATIMTIEFKGCGLGNVILKNGYKAHETKYGTAHSYQDIDGIYRAITIALCRQKWTTTPEIVRFLRKRLDMSQTEFGAEFSCTSQAVAKWEKGTSNIPEAAGRLMRLLCLNKYAGDEFLKDAMTLREPPSSGLIELEFSNSTWSVVGDHLSPEETFSNRPSNPWSRKLLSRPENRYGVITQTTSSFVFSQTEASNGDSQHLAMQA